MHDHDSIAPRRAVTRRGLRFAAVFALGLGCDSGASTPSTAKVESPTATKDAPTPTKALPAAPTTLAPTSLPTLTTVDDAARTRAAELTASRDGSFSSSVTIRHNAPALLHLAATAIERDLACAALEAISNAYGPEQTEQRRAFDADYFAVVRHRLASTDPEIEAAAFVAAEAGMSARPHDAALGDLLVDRAAHHPKPSGRIAALAALSEMKKPTKAVEDEFHRALADPSPSFVALALEQLGYPFGERLPDQPRLEARLVELLGHADPGVRGLAAITLAERTAESKERPRIAALLQPLTRDPHWFARLGSLEARAEVKDPTVIGHLIAGLDDTTEIRFVVPDWVGVDGRPASPNLGSALLGDTWSEAMVDLLREVTRGEPYAFDPTPYDTGDIPGSKRRQVEEAKAWAKANAALVRTE